MNDQISRQRLIEKLELWQIDLIPILKMSDVEVFLTLEKVIGIIGKQPPEDQWIPCSERLPDDGTEVFVTYLKLNRNMKAVGKSKYSENPEPKKNHWSYHGNRVIAWMPAEPYKGE